jgi:hypothetical protein
MHMMVFADDIGTQLLHGVFSWQFLQFLVTLVIAFGFVLTSAAFFSYADSGHTRKHCGNNSDLSAREWYWSA